MKYEIIPSLLPVEDRCQDAVRMLEGHVNSVHIDVMDGIFVEDIAFGVDEVLSLKTELKKVVHLMTLDLESKIPEYALAGADTIIFHIEAAKNPAKIIQQIKNEEAMVGISLKPRTPVERIKQFLKDVDLVLVMTVEPGEGGQKLMPEMLEKVRKIRKLNKNIDIEVDGGIELENIRQVKEAGANRFVVGSAIFGQKDPLKALEELKKR